MVCFYREFDTILYIGVCFSGVTAGQREWPKLHWRCCYYLLCIGFTLDRKSFLSFVVGFLRERRTCVACWLSHLTKTFWESLLFTDHEEGSCGFCGSDVWTVLSSNTVMLDVGCFDMWIPPNDLKEVRGELFSVRIVSCHPQYCNYALWRWRHTNKSKYLSIFYMI